MSGLVAPVIHIGGWPGAGKRSIGRIVADRLGGRLIDNHLMLDAARAIYDRDAPGSADLRAEVRSVILSHARRLPPTVPLVLTDALADEAASIPLMQPTLDLAQDRGARLWCFLLDLDLAENIRRLTDPARRGGAKLMDAEVLKKLRRTERLYAVPGAIPLDVTALSADQAAAVILSHVAGA